MKGWLLTIAIFLICLTAVRVVFGVNEPVRINEILTYLGGGFGIGADYLVGAIDYFVETSEVLESINDAWPSDKPLIIQAMNHLVIPYVLTWFANVANFINVVCNFIFVIFMDIIYIFRVLFYLIFGTPL